MPKRSKRSRLSKAKVVMPGAFRLSLPATSANLGPAFDAAALAMDFRINIDARAADEFAIAATGRDESICRSLENHLILDTYREVIESSGRKVCRFGCK